MDLLLAMVVPMVAIVAPIVAPLLVREQEDTLVLVVINHKLVQAVAVPEAEIIVLRMAILQVVE